MTRGTDSFSDMDEMIFTLFNHHEWFPTYNIT